MLKFIWNSWWRNKERFILLLVGVLIVSTGLSYLVGLTESNKGTVVSELEKRWKSSYHLVVRPHGTRSVTEELDLLEPNYMSGLDGGITLEQYEQIKQIEDIEVAAPIAMIGSHDYFEDVGEFDISKPVVYRVLFSEETNTGATVEVEESSTYFLGGWRPTDADPNYGLSPTMPGGKFVPAYGSSFMIAGVDPEAEAALVGLDKAIIEKEGISRYFEQSGEIEVQDGITHIPVLMSSKMFVDATMEYRLEEVELPFESLDTTEIADKVREAGGETFLDTLPGKETSRLDKISTKEVHQKLIQSFMDGQGFSFANESNGFEFLAFRPSSLDYEPVKSPFSDRWPFAYQVKPYEVPEDSIYPYKQMYRPLSTFGETSATWPKVKLNYIGVFDPGKLDMARDPLTDLPMETYFPAKADWVIDADDEPVNPVKEMLPVNNDRGFLTRPPLVLTTLEAAAAILGDEPISAIRVNVSGVNELNEESEAKLQAIAKEIEEKTGLITDVTLGSSPQMALTYLPGLQEGEALGWVQQPWVRLGSSFTIFEETKMGMGGVIASVILVAILYVFTSNVIMLYARKKEFAVLLSLGWGPRQLSRLLLMEALLLGGVVALIAWSILGAFLLAGETATTGIRVILIGFGGLGIYVMGSLVPMMMIRRIKPYEALRSGATTRGLRLVRAEGVIGMAFNQLVTQWKRTLLTLLAIAVPTSLFMFFLFVSVRLQGVMFTSLLGEYVALEVGTMHYVAMGVSLLIAVLTTTEVMWQNINERRSEIAILKATGWRSSNIRGLVLLEGGLLGLMAGVIGLIVAGILVWNVYGSLPLTEVLFLTATLLVPIITGLGGALLPAQMAVNVMPYQAMRGTQVNTKRTERRFKWVLGTVAGGLGAAVLTLFFFALPDGAGPDQSRETQEVVEGTSGEKIEDLDSGQSKHTEAESVSSSNDAIEDRGQKAYRYYEAGDPAYEDEYITIGDPVEPPQDTPSPSEGNKLVSIPLTADVFFEDKNYEGGTFKFAPQGYPLLDQKGDEYKQVSHTVVEQGGWENKAYLRVPSVTKLILTYEVPKETERVALIVRGDMVAGEYVIGLDLTELSLKASQEIERRGSDSLRYYEYDDPTYRDELVKIENIVQTPAEVAPAKPGFKLVSLAVRGDTPEAGTDSDGGMIKYFPPGYKLLGEDGEEYEIKTFTVVERGGWEHNSWLRVPSTSLVTLTYEIPEDIKRAALLVNGEIVGGNYVIAFDL
ncbi:FtsX-like permease family protein [Exiguobacterium aestuarii]|uniref:FtsX-like permease family protein n=1 Tax=Exiguobacterium aestuarii TaxID=273527 RepID=A0ABW2PQL5_9BACL|nr:MULTISPECIES: ABC transporter permease [Exiguobacterium]MCT4784785.1 ABC transporter permease [Exiguobacterium aestuarii]